MWRKDLLIYNLLDFECETAEHKFDIVDLKVVKGRSLKGRENSDWIKAYTRYKERERLDLVIG